ncbi:MAG: hypothetical protein ACM3ZE_05080, partial [Myxococcales bacterium]
GRMHRVVTFGGVVDAHEILEPGNAIVADPCCIGLRDRTRVILRMNVANEPALDENVLLPATRAPPLPLASLAVLVDLVAFSPFVFAFRAPEPALPALLPVVPPLLVSPLLDVADGEPPPLHATATMTIDRL